MGNEKIKLQIDELRFSWDEDKAEANFRKHGVTFEIATEVFFDENYLEHEERRDGETRYQILGKTFSPLVLFIVFVERITVDDEEIKLMSMKQMEL
ncbi:hypothetical protein FACS1894204_12930 [Synergistales bacterium]|nr:hypothetical protein FACS1894204_12930 [Synergistales bacterium]